MKDDIKDRVDSADMFSTQVEWKLKLEMRVVGKQREED